MGPADHGVGRGQAGARHLLTSVEREFTIEEARALLPQLRKLAAAVCQSGRLSATEEPGERRLISIRLFDQPSILGARLSARSRHYPFAPRPRYTCPASPRSPAPTPIADAGGSEGGTLVKEELAHARFFEYRLRDRPREFGADRPGVGRPLGEAQTAQTAQSSPDSRTTAGVRVHWMHLLAPAVLFSTRPTRPQVERRATSVWASRVARAGAGTT